MSNAPTTTIAGERLASDRLRGDWDADGTISVHLPPDVAERLLAERGWTTFANNGSTSHGWVSPAGRHYWHTSEALTVALIAENS